jgi:hypothetical protein
MVAIMVGLLILVPLKRNARARMVIGNGLDFPAKWSLMGK